MSVTIERKSEMPAVPHQFVWASTKRIAGCYEQPLREGAAARSAVMSMLERPFPERNSLDTKRQE